MNKTDALLWVQRIHEGIRALPEDAKIFGFEFSYNYTLQEHKAEIHLQEPLVGVERTVGSRFSGWHAEYAALTKGVSAWWAVSDLEADDE